METEVRKLTDLDQLRSAVSKAQAYTAEVAGIVAEIFDTTSDPATIFCSKTKPTNMTSSDLWARILDT